jgi:hypothetical protein
LLVPSVGTDGAFRESVWLDSQRLKLIPERRPVVLQNSNTPGPDKAPPKM